MSRASMIMRAFVQSDTQATRDPLGHKLPSTWGAKFPAAIACFVWTTSRMETVRESATIVVAQTRMMFPKGVAITELDRISHVTDRQGNMLFPGPFNVRSVEYKMQHWEAVLEEVS